MLEIIYKGCHQLQEQVKNCSERYKQLLEEYQMIDERYGRNAMTLSAFRPKDDIEDKHNDHDVGRRMVSVLKELQGKSTNWRELTITFMPTWKNYDEKRLFKMVFRDIRNILLKSYPQKQCLWFMFPEYSNTGVFHIHASITDVHKARYCEIARLLRRKYGVISLSMLVHYEAYINYVLKDRIGRLDAPPFFSLNEIIFHEK